MTTRESDLLYTLLNNRHYSVIYRLGDGDVDYYAAMFFTGNNGEDLCCSFALKEGFILDVFFKMRKIKNDKLSVKKIE